MRDLMRTIGKKNSAANYVYWVFLVWNNIKMCWNWIKTELINWNTVVNSWTFHEKKLKRSTQICGRLHWFTIIIALHCIGVVVAKLKWQKHNIACWAKWILTFKTKINNQKMDRNRYGAGYGCRLPFTSKNNYSFNHARYEMDPITHMVSCGHIFFRLPNQS